MTDLNPTEEKFEDFIERRLISNGYQSRHHSKYDRRLCLICDDVIEFIRDTQQEKWEQLENIYGADVENKILARISKIISVGGIIEALRNQIVDRGVYFDLCYFKPKSGLNPEHQLLHQKNRFTVIRQLHYSNQNQKSIDMVIFLNGLPLITMELKNQLTNQTVYDSQKQYQEDRDSREPLLQFKRCAAHFCVDNDKASMTTKQNGTATLFFPYYKGMVNPSGEHG